MAETDMTPEEAAAAERLPLYNVGDYDPATNVYGFDNDGHQVNQMRQARDAGIMGRLARRLAILMQSVANSAIKITGDNVALTAEDAENTRLDRIATGQHVTAAAGQVGLATGQADRSRDEADRAAGFAAGVKLPPITSADALKFLRAKSDRTGFEMAEVDLYSAALVQPVARSSNTQIVKADKGKLFVLTGTFTQTVVSPETLGAGHHYLVKNAGTGSITIPASDGRTNWIMYPGEMRLFQCDETTLRSEVLSPFFVTFIASGTFILPPGYLMIEGLMWAGGGGSSNASANQGGAGGGACYPIRLPTSFLSASNSFTIGAGGGPGTAGGNSTFAGLRAFGGARNPVGGQDGGGGGGLSSAGNGVFGGGPSGGLVAFVSPGGAGGGGGGLNSDNQNYRPGQGANYGGGGGGGPQGIGGGALYGGGGGATGIGSLAGGISIHGGNGGAGRQNGIAPGGGAGGGDGSGNAGGFSGAHGELRIWGMI